METNMKINMLMGRFVAEWFSNHPIMSKSQHYNLLHFCAEQVSAWQRGDSVHRITTVVLGGHNGKAKTIGIVRFNNGIAVVEVVPLDPLEREERRVLR
jgi:hypothetical protein